jgi:hypothetical protein
MGKWFCLDGYIVKFSLSVLKSRAGLCAGLEWNSISFGSIDFRHVEVVKALDALVMGLMDAAQVIRAGVFCGMGRHPCSAKAAAEKSGQWPHFRMVLHCFDGMIKVLAACGQSGDCAEFTLAFTTAAVVKTEIGHHYLIAC